MNWIILVAYIVLVIFCYKRYGKYAAGGAAVLAGICWLLWLGATRVNG